jgi:hypothetical protein
MRLTKGYQVLNINSTWTEEEKEQAKACADFLDSLLRGDHLTDDFLKHAVRPGGDTTAGRGFGK